MIDSRKLAKRALDFVAAATGLVALAPLIAVVSVAIKCSSQGPVFFRQERIGRGGAPFWLYKFRTMRPGAGGPCITAAGDARITPIGRWLRRSKLDELPQFWNVLRGEMSLVGPRPEVAEYVRLYDRDQRGVLSARPGITGPSQICFRDEEQLLALQPDAEAYYIGTLLPAKLAVDLEYARHGSFRGDLWILAGTLLALWGPSAALRATRRATPPPAATMSRPAE